MKYIITLSLLLCGDCAMSQLTQKQRMINAAKAANNPQPTAVKQPVDSIQAPTLAMYRDIHTTDSLLNIKLMDSAKKTPCK